MSASEASDGHLMTSLRENRRLVRRVAIAVTTAALVLLMAVNLGTQLFVTLTITGIAAGGVFALSGVGLVLTYKATGVFNFAHGAMAVVIAFVFWQFQRDWGLPLLVAAPVALLVAGPLMGMVFERLVFRPLEKRRASTAEKLVATLGAFVLLLGIVTVVWGTGTKTDTGTLFGTRALCPVGCGGEGESGVQILFGLDQLGNIIVVLAASVVLYLLFARTRLGTDIKAVVDRRELAELTSINANRISSLSWAMGAGLAGLTGVLLAPTTLGLSPFRLSLLVVETFAVPVVAQLTSLPLAILAGLGIGLLTNYLTQFSFAYLVNWAHAFVDWITPFEVGDWSSVAATFGQGLDQILPSAAVFVLFIALLLYRHMPEAGNVSLESFVARSAGGRSGIGRAGRGLLNVGILGVAAVLPFVLDLGGMRDAQIMLALAVIFVSIVVVTGYSGHITLAQAGFAGFGAFITARMSTLGVPVIPSMLIGGLACVPIGLGAGFPALKRRGLFLGLTTLALSLVLERGVFQNLYLIGGASASKVETPSIFGLDLGGNTAFYFYELVLVGLILALAHRLRKGRLGRILSAMRDSETAATSMGINLRKYKLFIFSASAFMAGVGGSMFAQAVGTFNAQNFITFNSLLWFAVVVVAGVASLYGALLAAFLFALLDTFLGGSGVSTFIIGLAALSLGRLPGGLIGGPQRLTSGSFGRGGTAEGLAGRPAPAGAAAGRARGVADGERPHIPREQLRPSPRALELLNGAPRAGDEPESAPPR